jgi:hypothetical protein
MKIGRPEYYIPSPTTVAHDVHHVFVHSQQQISALLHVSEPLGLQKRSKTFVTQFDTTAPKKTISSDPNYNLYKLTTDIDREEWKMCEALLVGAGQYC